MNLAYFLKLLQTLSQKHLQVLLATSLLILASCSVYKSTGRKNFESKAPSSVQTATAFSFDSRTDRKIDPTSVSNDKSTCWNQPASDPLWEIEGSTPLTVKAIGEDEIQVCQKPE